MKTKVKLTDEQIDAITLFGLKDAYMYITEPKYRKAVLRTIKYFSVPDEFKEWKKINK